MSWSADFSPRLVSCQFSVVVNAVAHWPLTTDY
jgi:hypothetical protein